MKLSRRTAGDVTILDIEGTSDADGALLDAVTGLLDRGERNILLVFRHHTLDSSALGAAMTCWLRARSKGATVKLASRQPKIWDLIRILRLNRVLECYRSEAEALESFAV